MKTKLLSLLYLSLHLAACGGSGSSGGNPPPPPAPIVTQPTSEDTAQANAAGLNAAVDNSAKKVTLAWTDTVAGADSYSVQQVSPAGSWTTVGTVPGQHGSRTSMSWIGAGAEGTTNVFRVLAVFPGYTVPLATLGHELQITVSYPTYPPTIAFDQGEPVAGLVNVSIAGGATYASVDYFLDLATLGSSVIGPTYAISVPLGSPGSHLVLARLKTGIDTYLELRRTVQVAEPGFAVFMASEDQGDTLVIKAYTRRAAGNVTITAFVDGVSVGTLTETNYIGTAGAAYRWQPPAANYTSGQHTVRVDASDAGGATASTSLVVNVSNPPVLTLTSPTDDMSASGILQVRGTATSDRAAPVNVFARLGNVTVLNAPGSPFSTDFSLAGLPAGPYDFYISATDAAGQVVSKSTVVNVTASGTPPAPGATTIEFDKTEPVTGLVTASIAGGGTYTSVEYFLDLVSAGSSTTGPSYPLLMSPGGPGSHLVIARLRTGATYVDLRRTIQVGLPGYQVFMASEQQGDMVVIKAYSLNGAPTASITAFIDGVSVGTLTETNYIGRVGPAYIWQIPRTNYVSGQHTVRVDATATDGATSTATLNIGVLNPPVLTLTSPTDGMVVSGTLQIRGTASSDVPGGFTVVGQLGSLTVLNTTTSPFSADFSLAGLPPGDYTFNIRVTNSHGSSVGRSAVITVAP